MLYVTIHKSQRPFSRHATLQNCGFCGTGEKYVLF